MIQSVTRALNIVEFISTRHIVGLSDISRAVGLHKSTTHELIKTLETMGYVRQETFSGKYTLGLKLFELGQIVLSKMDIRAIAMPYLLELVIKYEETVHLAILSHDEVVYIDKVDSPRSIRIVSKVGGRNPAYCTGVGKVLLAGMPDKDLQKTLSKIKFQQFTPKTITDVQLLKKHLQKVRNAGFATDDQELEAGLSCCAAPIRNHLGNVIAAISLSGPTDRMADRDAGQLAADVVNSARLISGQFGFSGRF